MNADSLIRGLGGRRRGSTWMAKCPAHPDNNPSLAITEKNGKILVYCHAGCSSRDVIDALRDLGLWEARNGRRELGPIIAEYNYTDEFGNTLYQVCRHEPKDFSQRRPNGYGGWIANAGSRRVLYHLPEVLESPIVFVTEGEKDAETLRSHGFVATTNSCGAGDSAKKWRSEYTGALAGRECILIPDNDTPGKERVITIAKALIGHAAKIVILELEGCKDVTEWFDQGHCEVELIDLVASEGVHSEA